MNDRTPQLSPLKQAYLALEEMQVRLKSELEASQRAQREPIAIIGLGCRFPGGANSPEAFWKLLREGVDAIREVPADRWNADSIYDPDPDAPGKAYTRWAGFLDEPVDEFDPQFFGISPREALSLDPQQRLLLEVSWEALENAGQAPSKLMNSRTGVFVGIASSDYANLHLKLDDPGQLDMYYASGVAHSIASGRLSYVLGLQGPSVSLDTACSSSLVAVHLAVQSLRLGECRMALAGGVNLILAPDNTIAFSKSRMLAADGHCKTFDARADGFADGEGAGVVVLKRLAEAQADGDRILAVIRGTAINQDGASSGLTAPNGPSQEAVIRDALTNGGVQPAEVSYIEAHGTGTSLGDPIEVQALGAVLKEGRAPDQPFLLGSVKTNLGHLEAAAGVAGLIKLVLMLQHGEVPPHLNFQTPSPFIPWDEIPAVVPRRLTPWPEGYARRIAGVSSFGFSGTNAHVVVEEAPSRDPETAGFAGSGGAPETLLATERPLHVLSLSAKNETALKELARRYQQYLTQQPSASLADIAFTANAGRSHFSHRLALVADSSAQVGLKPEEKLAAFINGQMPPGLAAGEVPSTDRLKIAFLFTGQGSQYVGMGRQLYETQPVFRQTLDRCAELLRPHLNQPLISILFSDNTLLHETAYTQPALFALEYALAQLWRTWGIEPTAVMGHSVGEYVAACIAGVFSLEEGLKLIAERGRLMSREAVRTLPGGAMAAVFADEATVAAAIDDYADKVSIAALNGPDNTVLSGAGEAVQAVLDRLQAQGIKSRRLNVSHAFHSPLMEPMLDEFESIASQLKFAAPRIRLISNLTGKQVSVSEITQPTYWRRHIREAVRFSASMETLRQQGYEIFVEIGPGATLLGLGQRCFPEDTGLWLPSLRQGQDDWTPMLSSLSALYTRGAEVDWAGFDRPYARRKLALPTYPFQRERYWLKTTDDRYARRTTANRPRLAVNSVHPLLGQRLRSALKTIQFESELNPESLSFLNDHRVHGTMVLPATAYIEMALSAAALGLNLTVPALEDLVIREPLVVRLRGQARTCQTILTPESRPAGRAGEGAFEIFSLGEGETDWTLHATGKVQAGKVTAEPTLSLDEVKTRCAESISANAHYGLLQAHGLDFGPSLRGVRNLWRREGEALGEIQLPEPFALEAKSYYLHPALLDACLQVVAAAHPEGQGLYLPLSLESFELSRPPGTQVWSHVRIRAAAAETLTVDIGLYDSAGQSGGRLGGLHLKRADRTALRRIEQSAENSLADWLYEMKWQPQPLPEQNSAGRLFGRIPELSQFAKRLQPHVKPLSVRYQLTEYAALLSQLESLSVAYILHAFRQMGWDLSVGQRVSVDSLAAQLGVIERHQRLMGRLLEMLAEDGLLAKTGSEWEVRRTQPVTDPQTEWHKLSRAYASIAGGEMALLGRSGPRLAEVLRGDVDPLQLLFPGGSFEDAERLYHHSPFAQIYNSLAAETVAEIVAHLPAGSATSRLRVLEIGAGTGGTTGYVLPALPAERSEYTFTDISPLFTAKAQQKFERYPFTRYQPLDIELDPAGQGFAGQQFDVIIAANVIHATADLRRTFQHVQQLLAPDGLMVMIEVTRPSRWVDLTFGMTEGWWKFSDRPHFGLRSAYPLLTQAEWLSVLDELGFSQAVALPEVAEETDPLAQQALILAQGPHTKQVGRWLIFADEGGTAQALAARLEARGESCTLIFSGEAYMQFDERRWQVNPARPADFERVLRAAHNGETCRGVLHFWNLDLADQNPDLLKGSGSVLHLVQALVKAEWPEPPRLWLITRNAQSVEFDSESLAVEQSLTWGLARTIALEHPELHCTRIDLAAAATDQESEALIRELLAHSEEDQVAFREGARYVARLARYAIKNERGQPTRLEIVARGALDHLTLRPLTRRAPGPNEVEIQVYATGLNFKDVMNALGMYPGDPGPLGGECAGVVVALGEEVTDIRVGDEVIALVAGSFSTFVIAPADFVAAKPEHLTFEEAATSAIPFVTAYYTLHHLGQMKVGDRVLIHAAAGGVGLAAVQFAQRAGAEIFATAGSPAKRDFLKSLGAPHVMDSRSLDFADEIMALTDGRGVDLILNSLAGEFIPKSLSVLAQAGRFLEIGKRGLLTDEQAAQLGRGIAYHIVDWSETAKTNPVLIRSILLEIVAGLREGRLRPLPLQTFPIEDAARAFRHMAQAKHIGKVVLTQPRPLLIQREATYLITGGLRGLGLLTARWLAERGARHLLLIGRNAPSEAARQVIDELERMGCQIVMAQVDISKRADVEQVLNHLPENMPPLRGIIHSAGVLDDGALVQQDWSRFNTVLAPKVNGAWHLHTLTRHLPLDFFVMYSSIASLLGSAGQGNHAAANAFMDGLAHRRRAQGLSALSINWGAWAEVGAAVEHGVIERLGGQGVGTIAPPDGFRVLEQLLEQNAAQVGVTPIRWSQFKRRRSPFLSELTAYGAPQEVKAQRPQAATDEPEWARRLAEAPAHKQPALLLTYVQEQAGRVLGIDPNQVRRWQTPLKELGLDSLMAVELRNRLGTGLGLKRKLPATLVFDYPTIESIADYLAQEILPNGKAAEISEPLSVESDVKDNGAGSLLESIEDLSDEEVDRIFAEKGLA